jgi:hypothetical protein
MSVSAINYKGTRIGQTISNLETTPEEKIRIELLNKFEKGIIDKDLFIKASAQLDDLIKGGKKTGEGSRGGKIIGHTQSGKPIYSNSKHESHKDFSAQDHTDAAELHHAHAERLQGGGSLANKDKGVKDHVAHSDHHYNASMGGQKDHGSAREHAKKQVYDHKYHHEMMKHHQAEGDKAYAAGKQSEAESHYEQAHRHFRDHQSKHPKLLGQTKSGKPVHDGKMASHADHKNFTEEDHYDAAEIKRKHWQENDHDKDFKHHVNKQAEIASHQFEAIKLARKDKK